MPRHFRFPRIASTPLIVAWLVIAAVLTLISVALVQSRSALLKNAASHANNLAQVLDTQTSITLYSVDATLQGLVGVWKEIDKIHRQAPGVMHEILREKLTDAEPLRSIYILDTKGDMLHDSSTPQPPRMNFSDRDYFTAHRSGESRLFVSHMMKGRLTGRWGMVLSRPIHDHDGSWAGVIVAAFEPRELERNYADLNVGALGLIVLQHAPTSSTVIRVPFREGTIGAVDLELAQLNRNLTSVDSHESTASLQGRRKLVATRRLPHYPFLISVALDKAEVLEPWNRDAIAYLLTAIVFCLMTVWLTRMQLDATRRRESLLCALKLGEDELRHHRDHLQDLVSERTAELTRAKEAAEKANLAKSEFLSNISHELRTPMHVILSFAKLGLERTQKGETPLEVMDQYFKRIRGSGERLLLLLNDLLDLSKLEAARMHYNFAPQSIRKVMPPILAEMATLSGARQQLLTLTVNTGDERVFCDATRIHQVMRNLLSNAIKFSPENSRIDIRVADGMLPDPGDRQATLPALEISVVDEGCGIPDNELDTIFDKFVQSSKTRSGAGGTGLGLAICREIVLHHGGQIWVANGAHGGAVFTVVLPREAYERQAAEGTSGIRHSQPLAAAPASDHHAV